jgi:hypothetical protein
MTGTLHEAQYTFMIVCHWILRMRNVSDKIVDKIKTHILCSITFWKSCHLWDNVEKYGWAGQATDEVIQHEYFACWFTKATDIHSQYVILIGFPWQQWLHEHPSILCLYLHCLSYFLPIELLKRLHDGNEKNVPPGDVHCKAMLTADTVKVTMFMLFCYY